MAWNGHLTGSAKVDLVNGFATSKIGPSPVNAIGAHRFQFGEMKKET